VVPVIALAGRSCCCVLSFVGGRGFMVAPTVLRPRFAGTERVKLLALDRRCALAGRYLPVLHVGVRSRRVGWQSLRRLGVGAGCRRTTHLTMFPSSRTGSGCLSLYSHCRNRGMFAAALVRGSWSHRRCGVIGNEHALAAARLLKSMFAVIRHWQALHIARRDSLRPSRIDTGLRLCAPTGTHKTRPRSSCCAGQCAHM